MTYAESIRKQIERQSEELRRLLHGVDDEAAAQAIDGEWSANELLLHLIGATGDVTAGLRRALTEDNPEIVREQAGGTYSKAANSGSRQKLQTRLLNQLQRITEAACGLGDESLRRPITIGGEDSGPVRVPVGLWIREAVDDHFDAHLEQLRKAVATARGGGGPPPPTAS